MIKDTLSNAKLYAGIKEGIDKILEASFNDILDKVNRLYMPST